MNFMPIFSPPATGKMAVGYTLAEQTGRQVFHNHMTIDIVLECFPFGHPEFDTLQGEFRRRF